MDVGFDSAHIKIYRLGIHEGVDEKVDYPRCISLCCSFSADPCCPRPAPAAIAAAAAPARGGGGGEEGDAQRGGGDEGPAQAAATADDDDDAREDAAAAPGRPFDSDKARGAESGRSRPRSKPNATSMNLTLRGCHAAEL